MQHPNPSTTPPPDSPDTVRVALEALDALKVVDACVLDVRTVANFTDWMIVAQGRSGRHIQALADKVVEDCKQHGLRPLGVEGGTDSSWILVDLGDAIVHVMDAETRARYNLENLWGFSPSRPDLSSL